MSTSKAELRDLLEKFLPRLGEANEATQREALRRILRATGYKKFLLAVESCREPLSFGYNLLLFASGLSKGVKGAGELKKGKTWKERMEAEGLEAEKIEKGLKKREAYKNNCFGRESEVAPGEHIQLTNKVQEARRTVPSFTTREEAYNHKVDWPDKRGGRIG